MNKAILKYHPTSGSAIKALTRWSRRTFATPPANKTDGAFTQAMPIGAFYENILKSELPPHPTNQSSRIQASAEKKDASVSSSSRESPSSSHPFISSSIPASAAPAPSSSTSPSSFKTGRERGSNPYLDSAPSVSGGTPQLAAPQQASSAPAADSSAQSRAQIVFGSELAGPAKRAERLGAVRARSLLVAGVLVPPRPDEQDNCCMSGCVNCVWDQYRDEMEAWAEASALAEQRQRQERSAATTDLPVPPVPTLSPPFVAETDDGLDVQKKPPNNSWARPHDLGASGRAISMDDDGGGSETNWNVNGTEGSGGMPHDVWNEELYRNVPVGIREFMKHEKKLKVKHT